MLKKHTGKTQAFLGKALRQNDPPTQGDSSIAKATRVFSSAEEAAKAFSFLRKRLLQIEHWNDCSEISSFALFGGNGNPQQDKLAAVGDFIKITLPGSGKDDWVNIVQIYETPDEVILTLKPSHDPTDKDNKDSTSHFFTGDSTNNFCLQRKDAKINFYVIGLNEKTNTEDTSGILETARNFATANIGCLLGIQKAQWETFCKNFLEVRNEK